MLDHQLGDHFLAVRVLRADHHRFGAAPIAQVGRAQHHPPAFEQRFGLPGGLERGVLADHRLVGDRAPAVVPGCTGLERGGGRMAGGTGNAHPVSAFPLDRHCREIARHVGHEVGLRIADFVKHLLGHRAHADQPAAARRLGDHATAIAMTLGNRRADRGPAFDLAPVGEGAAGDLRAAFDQVPRQRAPRQLRKIVRSPAEAVDQQAQRQRRIDHSPGHHDLRAFR